jgi:hypothetical protein
MGESKLPQGMGRRAAPALGAAAACVMGFAAIHACAAEPLHIDPPQLEADASFEDNVTHAAIAPDRLADRRLALTLSRSMDRLVSAHLRGVVSGSLSATKWARYDGLDRLAASLSGELQYRASSAFSAPTISAFARVQHDEFRAGQRSGHTVALGASARQSWTDRIDTYAAFTWSRRDANDSAFDQTDRGVGVHLDYALPRLGTIYAGAEYRRGDVLASVRSYEPEYVQTAGAFAEDDAFGAGFVAYRFGGETVLWSLGWSLPVSNASALDLSWRQAVSRVNIPADPGGAFAAETLRYRTNLYSLSYLLRF